MAWLKTTAFELYKWGIIVPALILSTFVIGMIAIVISLLGGGQFASRYVASFWARFNAFISLMDVDIEGLARLDPTKSYVIVANHQSLLDIYALYGFLPIDIKWVMKKELRRIPVLGLVCELMGHIFIDRSRTEAALAAINAAADSLTAGQSIIFFPEGTRSVDGQVLPFKKGAFRFSIQTGLPLLPISLVDTHYRLPSGTTDLSAGSATIVIHPPIPIDEGTDVTTLTEQSRKIIANTLNERQLPEGVSRVKQSW